VTVEVHEPDLAGDGFRVISEDEWMDALASGRVRGADERAMMTHILSSVGPNKDGEKVDIMAFFAIPATLAYEVAAVVVGVVAADVVDNIIDRKFPEPRRALLPSVAIGDSPPDFQVAALPPIPPTRSLSPHRGVAG
jgi:hypothetical protein